jgi:hypothetical protein
MSLFSKTIFSMFKISAVDADPIDESESQKAREQGVYYTPLKDAEGEEIT